MDEKTGISTEVDVELFQMQEVNLLFFITRVVVVVTCLLK